MKKILITGIGFIGTELTLDLKNKGNEVQFLTRDIDNKIPYKKFYWNIDKEEADLNAFKNVDHIIHLAGANIATKRWTKKRKHELTESRVKSTRLIYETLMKHNLEIKSIVCASAIGFYGAINSNNIKLINKCRKIRNYGQTSRYKHVIKGVNSRMDEIQANFIYEKLNYLEIWNKKRKKIAEKYDKDIKNSKIIKLNRIKSKKDSFYLYIIKSKYRKKLINHLKRKKIQSIIHYPILSFNQKFNFRYQKIEKCTNAENISKTCLSIPCHQFLKKSEIYKIIKTLNEFR